MSEPNKPDQTGTAREWVSSRTFGPWQHSAELLADRCDRADKRCSHWADIAGQHGAECDKLRTQLAAAQSEALAWKGAAKASDAIAKHNLELWKKSQDELARWKSGTDELSVKVDTMFKALPHEPTTPK